MYLNPTAKEPSTWYLPRILCITMSAHANGLFFRTLGRIGQTSLGQFQIRSCRVPIKADLSRTIGSQLSCLLLRAVALPVGAPDLLGGVRMMIRMMFSGSSGIGSGHGSLRGRPSGSAPSASSPPSALLLAATLGFAPAPFGSRASREPDQPRGSGPDVAERRPLLEVEHDSCVIRRYPHGQFDPSLRGQVSADGADGRGT